MLAKNKSKKSFFRVGLLVFALAMVLAGCMPAGPRALLKGRKYIERGDYAAAVSELKTATTLLATNANAWNYYGVALQHAGQAESAASAYKRSLELDRDLAEAHFNLGSLWLEQSKPEQARTEFTTYTLQRGKDADGWMKLGIAQLKTGDAEQSKRSFSAVRTLRSNDPAAYNWLGMARMKSGPPRDAASCFEYAVRVRPDFGPALFNLATVEQQYLHDNKSALDHYHAYLALNPRPANWDEVNALASSLENGDQRGEQRTTSESPAQRSNPPLAESKPAQRNQNQTPTSQSQHTSNAEQPSTKSVTHATPPPHAATVESYPPPPSVPVQSVQVEPEPPIVTVPQANPPATAATAHSNPSAEQAAQSVEVPMPPPSKKPGFWHRLFGGGGGVNDLQGPVQIYGRWNHTATAADRPDGAADQIVRLAAGQASGATGAGFCAIQLLFAAPAGEG